MRELLCFVDMNTIGARFVSLLETRDFANASWIQPRPSLGCHRMKVLCVAEKPSIAKSVAQILSGGRYDTVSVVA